MPFGLRIRVGPRNHVLHGSLGQPESYVGGLPDHPVGRAIFRGKGASYCKVKGHAAVICAKTAKLIEMPLGFSTQMGTRNYV